MAEKSVKCYGMQIDSAEVILSISNGKWEKFLEDQKPLGVFQDPAGQLQVMIFLKKEEAKAAVAKAKEMKMSSVAVWPTMIYVTENDLQIDLESFGAELECEECVDESDYCSAE